MESRLICQSPRAICSALKMQSSLDGIPHRAQRSQSPQTNSAGCRKDRSVLASLLTKSRTSAAPMFVSSCVIEPVRLLSDRKSAAWLGIYDHRSATQLLLHRPQRQHCAYAARPASRQCALCQIQQSGRPILSTHRQLFSACLVMTSVPWQGISNPTRATHW